MYSDAAEQYTVNHIHSELRAFIKKGNTAYSLMPLLDVVAQKYGEIYDQNSKRNIVVVTTT